MRNWSSRLLGKAGDALEKLLSGKSIASAMAQTMGFQVIVLLLNVSTGILSARILGPEGRGIFAAVTIWPPMVAGLTMIGLPSALTFHLKTASNNKNTCLNGKDYDALLSSGLVLAWLLGCLATAISAGLPFVFLGNYEPHISLFAASLAPLAFANAVVLTMRPVLLIERRYLAYNVTHIATPVAFLFLLLSVPLFVVLTPFVAALCLLLPTILIATTLLAWLFRTHRFRLNQVAASWSKLLRFMLRLSSAEFTQAAFPYIDRLLLIALVPSEALGLYVVAHSFSRFVSALQQPITALLLPALAGRSLEEISDAFGRALRFSLLFLASSILLLFLVSEFLIVVFYGEAFHYAVYPFRILVIEAGIAALGSMFAQCLLALNRPAIVSVAQTTALLVALSSIYILVPAIGLLGAACGLLAASIARLSVAAIATVLLGVRHQRLLPNKEDLSYALDRLGLWDKK